MIAGADEPAVKLVAQLVPASTSNDGAPEIPGGRNLSAGDAALVNGVAAHVLDYDDVGMDGHPSAALTPAILAEGWTLGVERRGGACRLCGGLRGVGAAAGARARRAARARLPPDRDLGNAVGGGGLRAAQPARIRGDHQRHRDRGLARGRHGGEFRHHDQVAACRPHRAVRRAGGAAGEVRLHRLARRAGAQGRLHGVAYGGRQSGCDARRLGAWQQLAARAARHQHQALSDVLCDPPLDRRHDRSRAEHDLDPHAIDEITCGSATPSA